MEFLGNRIAASLPPAVLPTAGSKVRRRPFPHPAAAFQAELQPPRGADLAASAGFGAGRAVPGSSCAGGWGCDSAARVLCSALKRRRAELSCPRTRKPALGGVGLGRRRPEDALDYVKPAGGSGGSGKRVEKPAVTLRGAGFGGFYGGKGVGLCRAEAWLSLGAPARR